MAKKVFTVDFQARFYNDVENAVKYYETRQKGLGKRFNHKVIQTLKTIKRNPTTAHFMMMYIVCKSANFPTSFIILLIHSIIKFLSKP